jgi:phosphoglycerol transferase
MNSLKSLTLNAKLFYVLVLGIFVAILMRNSALYPSIFADEYVYSSAARLYPLSEASIANYLYLWVYRLTNVCSDGFLSCARILNTTFFILACPFIYQTAKRVCSKSIAKYIAILSLIGPINIYTANFMPEAMYFLGFWIFAWYTLGLNSASTLKSWFGVGALIGICMLIKPHGFFLLPPTLLYLLILFKQKPSFEIKQFMYAVTAIICGSLICKIILGFLIAGVSGLSFLGHLYSATTQDFFNATITYYFAFSLTSD